MFQEEMFEMDFVSMSVLTLSHMNPRSIMHIVRGFENNNSCENRLSKNSPCFTMKYAKEPTVTDFEWCILELDNLKSHLLIFGLFLQF